MRNRSVAAEAAGARAERGAEPDGAGSAGDTPAELALDGVSKEFHGRNATTLALTDITFSVGHGEFVTLVGRSGCGKTTLLRILAGLTTATSGTVHTGGRPLWKGSRRDSDAARKLGLVFQDANLFPWYSVEDNIALPLRLRGVAKRTRRERARELCEVVGLSGFERSYPRELSGGMRQRVAIARSLSYDPSVLLMDEPFGALDALTRDKLNLELQSIASMTGATVVFVTHSITEAVFLSDRVVLLSPRPGRIRSITTVSFPRPRTLDIESEPAFQDIVRHLRHQLEEDA